MSTPLLDRIHQRDIAPPSRDSGSTARRWTDDGRGGVPEWRRRAAEKLALTGRLVAEKAL